jgi:hypothetical protein
VKETLLFVRFDFIISSSGCMLAGEMQGDEESRYGAVLFWFWV